MHDYLSSEKHAKTAKVDFAMYVNTGNDRHISRFSKDVVWLRSVEPALELEHRGVPIKSISQYCDSRGYMSAIGSAAEDASSFVASYKIKPDDALKLVAYLSIVDRAYLVIPTGASDIYRRYQHVPDNWYTCVQPYESEESPFMGENGLRIEVDEVILCREYVWDSSQPVESLARMQASFIERFPMPA
jgi:hypothetical protein